VDPKGSAEHTLGTADIKFGCGCHGSCQLLCMMGDEKENGMCLGHNSDGGCKFQQNNTEYEKRNCWRINCTRYILMDPCGSGCVFRPKKTQTRKFREEVLGRIFRSKTEKVRGNGENCKTRKFTAKCLRSHNQGDELH
jgi:hypothetical protein